jgi:hypothetical protein
MANDDIERLLDDGACTAGDAPEREMLQPARRRERRKIAAGYRSGGRRFSSAPVRALAIVERPRVDAVDGTEDAHRDERDQEEDCSHADMLPSRDYQHKSC